MTIRHVIDYYMDNHIMIAFCKVCSAEGDKLLEECPGKFPYSTEHRKMADYLNLHPDKPETWPISILDRLIYIKSTEGDKRLFEELRKLSKSS